MFSDSSKSSRTLSDCSSPSRQHKLSNKILPKSLSLYLAILDCQIGIACLAIGCRKIPSEDLAIRHSQIAKRLFSKFSSPNRHRLFSDKRAQNCRIYLATISSRSPVFISNRKTPNVLRSFSDADDVMMTSSTKNEGIWVMYQNPPNKDLS